MTGVRSFPLWVQLCEMVASCFKATQIPATGCLFPLPPLSRSRCTQNSVQCPFAWDAAMSVTRLTRTLLSHRGWTHITTSQNMAAPGPSSIEMRGFVQPAPASRPTRGGVQSSPTPSSIRMFNGSCAVSKAEVRGLRSVNAVQSLGTRAGR